MSRFLVVVQFDPNGSVLLEIPRPAGENAGLRDDAGKMKLLDSSNCTTTRFLAQNQPNGIGAGTTRQTWSAADRVLSSP